MAVMNVKATTKNWREPTPGDYAPKDSKVDANMTPDQMKTLGVDNVGDYLNKIADPNWVDPSKKMRVVGNDKLDKDAFMKLMLAQMKQQDPTNPLKSHEMAAHLAQFSQLEQLANMNQSLEALREGQKPTESFQALNFIGKWVAGDASKVLRAKGDKDHEFSFQLAKEAADAVIKVRDSRGEIVRTVDLKQLPQGANRWIWNGAKDNGSVAPAGEYQIMIEAKTDQGQRVHAKTDFQGVISGVQYTVDGPVLMVGTQTIKLKDVKKIVDPNQAQSGAAPTAPAVPSGPMSPAAVKPVQQNDQKVGSSTSSTLKPSTQPDKIESVEGAPEATPAAGSQLLSEVGLSREMKDRLEKETAL